MELMKKQGIFIVLCLVLLRVYCVGAVCSFPSSLRGNWVRTRPDAGESTYKTLTFNGSDVKGFEFTYFAQKITNFDCYENSGDDYVLSAEFKRGDDYRYLFCWKLEKVTSSAYILYELTEKLKDPNITPQEPGVTRLRWLDVVPSRICSMSSSNTLFTTLIKEGARPSDVASECPSALFATFTYKQCSDSSLSFCPDRTTAAVDYRTCPTILNSKKGVLSCMGHAEQIPFIYINLFDHEESRVTCLKIPSGSTSSSVSAVYYTGDCTTATGSSSALNMTSTKKCPKASDGVAIVEGSFTAVAAVASIVVVGKFYY